MDKTEQDVEHERWQFEQNRQMAEVAHERESQFFQQANEFSVNAGNIALRSFLLINGGAAVALLAFIGSLVSGGSTSIYNDLPSLTAPLMWFVWGVALSSSGFGIAFFANRAMGEQSNSRLRHYENPYVRTNSKSRKWLKISYSIQGVAVISALASLACFLCGMLEIKDAISSLTPPNL